MTTRSFRIFAAALALGVLAVLLPVSSPVVAQGANEFTVTGKGWGHGVGMSQHGAYGRANAGQSYQQILDFYYPGTTLQTQSMPADLKVLLATSNSTTVKLASSGSIQMDGSRIGTAPVGATIAVSRTGSSYQISVNGSSICPSGGCAGNRVEIGWSGGTMATLGATGRNYRWGRLTFVRSSSSMYVILDKLPMRLYLWGLGEMPSSWPAEALKTQAVAARSYALEAVQRRRAASSWTRPWDLYASTQDQAYVGASQEVSAWTSQVDATLGQVSTYAGKPIQAFYSSSNGGHTELSSYVFSASLPYLPAQPDSHDDFNNSFATWTRTFPAAQLSKWLGAYGDTSVGDVQAITLSGNIGVSGRTNRAEITLTGTAGTKTVGGNRFMVVVNVGAMNDGLGLSSQILSTLYTVSGSAQPPPGSGGGGDDGGQVDPAPPTGYFDRAEVDAPGVVGIVGWAADASDPTAKVQVHFYVDGNYAGGMLASRGRPDVGAYTGWGDYHGWGTDLNVGTGTHEICAYAINIGPSAPNTLLGCRTVTSAAPTEPADEAPIGYFDRAEVDAPGVVGIVGWAADASDPTAKVQVHFYVDGNYAGGMLASRGRPDVGAYTGWGDYHGWGTDLNVGTGTHEICAYAINIGPSAPNTLLGCRGVSS